MSTITKRRARRRPGGRQRPPGLTVTGVSERERQLLQVIAQRIDHNGTQPSIREIATIMGYRSIGFVHHMIQNLIRKGVIAHQSRGSRCIAFTWRNWLHD